MAEVIIHGVNGSPFVRAAEMVMVEKGQPHRLVELAPGPTGTKSEAYLKLHPFGRVPAFEHGDFRFYETQAFLRYIDAVFPEPALQPTDPRAIARMNQIIGVNDWYFFPKAAAVIVFNRIVGPALMGRAPDEAAIEAAAPDVKLCVGELEQLLGSNAYLAGDKVTLADIHLAPQVDFFSATPEGARALAGTRLEAWLARMNERPSMKQTQRPAAFRAAA
jgi:glutathione S-transferase